MASFKLFPLILIMCCTHSSEAFLGSLFGPQGFLGSLGIGGRLSFGGRAVSGSGQLEAPVCSKAICANYTVIRSDPTYEYRRYEGMTLATTITTTSSLFMTKISMYRRLKRYVKGGNSGNTTMNMTYPILSPIHPPEGNASMMFILPTSTPPQPLSTLVYLISLPPMEIYARRFRGNSNSANELQEEIAAFRASLGPASQGLMSEAFVAEFNSPFSIFNRFTELWLVAKHVPRIDQDVFIPAVDTSYQNGYQNAGSIF